MSEEREDLEAQLAVTRQGMAALLRLKGGDGCSEGLEGNSGSGSGSIDPEAVMRRLQQEQGGDSALGGWKLLARTGSGEEGVAGFPEDVEERTEMLEQLEKALESAAAA